jgi:CP family cyanate transporter-like MFS transporter
VTRRKIASVTALGILGIVVVALSMRSAVGVLGPVYPIIADDLGLDILVLSVLGALPPLGFAAAGLIVPAVVRRIGLEGSLIASMTFIAGGQIARSFGSEPVLLTVSTSVIMVGIGAANVLLPPIVRRYVPGRIGLITAIYLVLMSLSASIPAFVGVQLAEATSWQFALGLWAVLPVLAIAPWITALAGRRRSAAAALIAPEVDEIVPTTTGATASVGSAKRRSLATSPTAWAITATLALTSVSVYAAIAFLPAMLVTTAGVTAAVGGAALGVALALGIPEALAVPWLAVRRGTTVPMIVVAALCALGGWTGMLLAPGAAPFLWAALIGLVPIVFPLALLLVNSRTRDPAVTVSVSAFVQGLGYVTAGVFSLLLGLVHDATGSWTLPFLILAGTALFAVPAILVLRRERFVDDEIAVPPR